MESHEVLRETINVRGVKAVAAEMNLSTSLVYKWCKENSPDDWGAQNPLDRILKIVEITGDTRPIHWLCQAVDGFFVENPARGATQDTPFLQATQQMLSEFSEMLQAVSESYGNDSSIDSGESERIRREWEELKTLAEAFVVACERGGYSRPS